MVWQQRHAASRVMGVENVSGSNIASRFRHGLRVREKDARQETVRRRAGLLDVSRQNQRTQLTLALGDDDALGGDPAAKPIGCFT